MFVVGLGHAPIPANLGSSGHFVDLADLLSANLRAVEHERQRFLDGKLVISFTKRQQVEIQAILT